jgi:hypothetical protein
LEGRLSLSPMVTALLFFVLTTHALFVGTTHTHRGPNFVGAFDYTAARNVGERQDAPESKKGTGHAQCLLCRLQRDLSSGLRHAVPQTEAPCARALALDSRSGLAVRSTDLNSPSGRGPPSA